MLYFLKELPYNNNTIYKRVDVSKFTIMIYLTQF